MAEFTPEELEQFQSEALIEKSKPLFDVVQTNWTLNELKLLDIYLARINARDPNTRTVTFDKGELEKLLGVKRIREKYIIQWIDALLQVVEITDPDTKKKRRLVLFETYLRDKDANGQWKIELTCTPIAKEYFFNVENIGYIQYQLQNILDLNSRYSYALFLYLLKNEYKSKWIENLSNLKILLNCLDPIYNEYKYFYSQVIKPAQKEILEKTDITFVYLPIREGRKIKYIQFTVERKNQFLKTDDIVDVDVVDSNFDKFWKTYPKKENRVDAEKAWNELNPSDELVDTIISSVNQWKKTSRWQEEDGRFVPQAGKWLLNKRWEDEVPKTKTGHTPSYDSSAYWEKARKGPGKYQSHKSQTDKE